MGVPFVVRDPSSSLRGKQRMTSSSKGGMVSGARRCPLAVALWLAIGLGGFGLHEAAWAQAGTTSNTYAQSAQPLGPALNRLAETADRQILVPPELVRGRSAPALAGRHTVEQALDLLLAGSGLAYRVGQNGVITIVQGEAATSPPPMRPVPPPANPSQETPTTEMAAVQVTGSRIKRAEIEGPSPVTVITSEQMENEGFVTVFEALDSLVMASGSVETELSGGFSANAHPLNLRGLGPGRSLLLIDGRRAADYPFPYQGRSNFQNFGNIPSGAVERIEILAGGASAIYGADAVAGVVNVVLKKGHEGDALKVRTGTSTMGGRDRLDVQWTGGRAGEDWSLTYAAQYYYQDILYGFERDFWSRSANPAPNPVLGEVPSLTRGVRIRRTTGDQPRNITPPEGACERWGGEFVNWLEQSFSSSTGLITDRGWQCATFNDEGYQHLSKGKQEVAGYLFGTRDFANGMQGVASLQVWHSRAKSLGGFESITGPHVDGVGRRSTFFDPNFGAVIETHRGLNPVDLGSVEAMNQDYYERSVDLALGLRGTWADRFDWEATLSRAQYNFVRERRRLVGALVSDFFFGPELGRTSAGVPIHELDQERWWRPLTPQEYESLSTIARYDAKSWVNTASFVLTGDLLELPAGPLAFATVLEASGQGYDLDSDPRALPSRVELYNLTTTNGGGDRERYAAGLELSIPLLDSLRASLAGRYDYYDDITTVGGAATYNIGLEWRPLESLLIRGAYATSFKAPDMHWVFSEGSGSFGTSTDWYRCLAAGGQASGSACVGADAGTSASYSIFSTNQGNPDLEEETGKSWSVGAVWDVLDDLSLSLDYWDIELDGAIQQLSVGFLLENEAGCRTGRAINGQPFQFAPDSAFCQAIVARVDREADPSQPTDRIRRVSASSINQAYRRVSGLDGTVNWRLRTDRLGDYRFNVAWSHTLRSERQVFATDPVEAEWRDDRSNLDFRSRVRGGVDWRGGDWRASLFATRYGSLPKRNPLPDGTHERTRIHIVWNANVGYRFTDDVNLRFYVNNLFNNIHPQDETNTSFPYFYDHFSPVGREVSVQLEYRFH